MALQPLFIRGWKQLSAYRRTGVRRYGLLLLRPETSATIYFSNSDFVGNLLSRNSIAALRSASLANSESFIQKNTGL